MTNRSQDSWTLVVKERSDEELAHFITGDLVGYRATSKHRDDDEKSLVELLKALREPRWNTSSIEGMERSAQHQTDEMCCVKIRDAYLEVSISKTDVFLYKWGKNFVERKEAVSILATREKRS